jgi:dipeptide/tripeptide permease
MTSAVQTQGLRHNLASAAWLLPGVFCMTAAVPFVIGFVSDWIGFHAGFNAFAAGVVACFVLGAAGGPFYFKAVMYRAAPDHLPSQRRSLRGGLWLTAVASAIGVVAGAITIIVSVASAVTLVGAFAMLRRFPARS